MATKQEEVAKLLLAQGFVMAGEVKPTAGNDSQYVEYKRGKESVWLGRIFLESESHGHALDYSEKSDAEILSFIAGEDEGDDGDDYGEDVELCDNPSCQAELEEGRIGYCDECLPKFGGAQSEYDESEVING